MARVSRDMYDGEVDFTALALQHPAFAHKLKCNGQLDFSDPDSVRQLTKALLQRDFDLSIDLPDDRLCPPVPNRFNYVTWLQDLIDTTSDDFRDTYAPDRAVVGLDIGTGASAIYPLLACRQRPSWRFYVTETDPRSLRYAAKNIAANHLQARVKYLAANAEKSLLPLQDVDPDQRIDFVMTNPPFYESEAEMLELAQKKNRPPSSACTGSPSEMITPGGEVQFVTQLIDESTLADNGQRIQWFTSMLGKLSSVTILVQRLRAQGCSNYAVTEFVQGTKTRRWGIAWSWQLLRPPLALARGISAFDRHLLPFPPQIRFDVAGSTIDMLAQKINHHIQQLHLQWQWKHHQAIGIGMALRDEWSRKARRRKQQAENGDTTMTHSPADDDDDEDGEEEAALVFKIALMAMTDAHRVVVDIRWLQGANSILFESFCGWLKRKAEDR